MAIGLKIKKIGIMGFGYVGAPLASAFLHAGKTVCCFDIDTNKVERVMQGDELFPHLGKNFIGNLIGSNSFTITDEINDLQESEVIIICVPTPIDQAKVPDLRAIKSAVTELRSINLKNKIIVLESSTYPGCTEELLENNLNDVEGIKIGFSPEREDPGNPNYSTTTIPKIVAANDPKTLSLLCHLYEEIIGQVVGCDNIRTAEATKLTENIFRCINISLVNELKLIYNEMNINIHEVVRLASTKPFGYMPFFAGPGVGGHCIPVDPYYLTWASKKLGYNTEFIELAGKINDYIPKWVVDQIIKNNAKKRIIRPKVLMLGYAYKKNVSDFRQTPALEIYSLLSEYYNTFVYDDLCESAISKLVNSITTENFDSSFLSEFDQIVIVTDHDSIDYALISEEFTGTVYDTRDCFSARGLALPKDYVSL